MLHSLLQRQLKKAGLSEDAPPQEVEAWKDFLEHVSRTYTQAEEDRYLLERSLNLASEEMQAEITERKRAEEAVRQANEDLARQNSKLQRLNELFRAMVEHLTMTVKHDAPKEELVDTLRMLENEFERFERSNGK